MLIYAKLLCYAGDPPPLSLSDPVLVRARYHFIALAQCFPTCARGWRPSFLARNNHCPKFPLALMLKRRIYFKFPCGIRRSEFVLVGNHNGPRACLCRVLCPSPIAFVKILSSEYLMPQRLRWFLIVRSLLLTSGLLLHHRRKIRNVLDSPRFCVILARITSKFTAHQNKNARHTSND